MVVSYRLFKTKFMSSWFDGVGAFRFGGRWNSRGKHVLYTGENLALTALELLVRLRNEHLLLSYSFATIEFDEDLVLSVEDIAKLPNNWSQSPHSISTQNIGDDWVKSNASVVLRVPTAILPVGYNYVVNVEHEDFSKIRLGESRVFTFDRRLKPSL